MVICCHNFDKLIKFEKKKFQYPHTIALYVIYYNVITIFHSCSVFPMRLQHSIKYINEAIIMQLIHICGAHTVALALKSFLFVTG